MSVSELREWLKRFEKKHQDHYQQNQVARRRSPTTLHKKGRERLSVRNRICDLEKQPSTIIEEGDEDNDERYYVPENPGTDLRRTVATTMESSMKCFGKHYNNEENERPSLLNQVRAPFATDGRKHSAYIPSPPFNDEPPSNFEDMDSLELASSTEQKGSPQDISLALSAVTITSSTSSSVEKGANTKAAPTISTEKEPSKPTSKQSHRRKVVESVNRAFAKAITQRVSKSNNKATIKSTKTSKSLTAPPPRKVVPEEWSDFEPVDFDASFENSSDSENEKEAGFKSWPGYFKDPKEYLKKQSVPSFQGYWSDDEDFRDFDDSSVATGRRTEPPQSRYFKSRSRRGNCKNGTRSSFPMQQQRCEDSVSILTLADAAASSMPGGTKQVKSKQLSLSEHFLVNKKCSGYESPMNGSMHDADVICNTTMTAGALDVICNGKSTTKARKENDKKTLEKFFERGDQGPDDWSVDSGKPSIAPGAVDDKLSQIFANNQVANSSLKRASSDEMREPKQDAYRSAFGEERETVPDLKCHTTTGKIAGHLDTTKAMSGGQDQVSSKVVGVSVAGSSISSSSSTFSSNVKRFGGVIGERAIRKTRIQRQKEALEEQWATNRQVKHVKKTKWQISSAGGGYKKKIVLDVEEK